MPDAGSVSFERLAGVYDATRGGLARGRGLAADLAPFVAGTRLLEIGVGTGAVAAPLEAATGCRLVGIDLSPAMLAVAARRLGPAVAVADAERLPVATGAVDTAVMVWVLQLVARVAGVLGEAARALRPGGRIAVVLAAPAGPPDEIDRIVRPMYLALLPPEGRRDRPELVVELARAAGLRLVHRGLTTPQHYGESPDEEADRLERRTAAILLDLSPEAFAALVAPVVAKLRALPRRGEARPRRAVHELLVFERELSAPGAGLP